jgi:hypothetical protein
MTRRFWTEAECATLRARYGREPAATLAARLGRTLKGVYLKAHGLGLVDRNFVWPPAADRLLRRRHAAGWSDTEVAAELGCERHRVAARRKALGLPALFGVRGAPWTPRRRRLVAEATRRQLAAAGCATLAELRVRRFAAFAESYGLPGSVGVRGTQVVVALAAGPMTRREIVAALGLRWKPGNGGRNNLSSSHPEGSYLGHLQALGLVARVRRHQSPSVYVLTAACLDRLADAGKGCA